MGSTNGNGYNCIKLKTSSSGKTWGRDKSIFGVVEGDPPSPLPQSPHQGKPCYPEMKSSEGKHLRMLLFYQNKNSRSKDQNKNELHSISPAIKTNGSRIFFTVEQNFISVSYKHPLNQSFYNDIKRS